MGLEYTGIYRVPGNNAMVSLLQDQLNKGLDINPAEEVKKCKHTEKKRNGIFTGTLIQLLSNESSNIRRRRSNIVISDSSLCVLLSSEVAGPQRCQQFTQIFLQEASRATLHQR